MPTDAHSMQDHVLVMRYRRLCWIVLALAAMAGCGGQTAPVNGRVKFKDGSDVAALAGYEVAFEPVAGKASSVGQIAPDGTFKLSTFGADDGAIPGQYRVAISPPQSPDPDKPPQKPQIPAKYSSFEASGLSVDIKPGRNDVELVVDRTP